MIPLLLTLRHLGYTRNNLPSRVGNILGLKGGLDDDDTWEAIGHITSITVQT